VSSLYVVIAAALLSLLFPWIENAINPNMSKLARVGFRLAVLFFVGIIVVQAMFK
jgi:hypothetical protein